MTAALDYPTLIVLPTRRPPRYPAPSGGTARTRFRSQRRRTAAGTMLSVLGCAVLLAVALASAHGVRTAGRGTGPAAVVVPSVTVRQGDTLWSIAGRVAPQRDPRAEVADLIRRNALPGPDIAPGQILRVP